ncbi:MAG: hypothetical protein L0H96_18185 [Humibacillus sp.]|nr:hypothetical protein [Humibacillus sp.]MDN5778829.1 hypothetical protein [Humibacillus sp.]
MSTTLIAWAQRHLRPLGLTVAQARREAAAAAHPSRAYATPGAFEAFYRLRAHAIGAATPITRFSPIVPAHNPLVITTGGQGEVHLHHDGSDYLAAEPSELTALLATMPVRADSSRHPVLVVDGAHTLRTLAAVITDPDLPRESAAGLDWLIQRAEHPGSTAAYVLSRDLRRRWITGTHPTARLALADWSRWLGVTPGSTPARDALTLVEALAQGHTLSGLLDFTEDDTYSWERLGKGLQNWRARDSRASAALGLLSRSHAAELYDSLSYGDPLVADRQTRTGTILETVVLEADHTAHIVTVETTSTLNRHRVGSRLQAWAGDAAQAADPAGSQALTSAVLTQIEVTPGGTLRLTLSETVAPARPSVGEHLTLRPKAADPWHQRKYRATYAAHYRTPGNVFSRRQQIPTTRRTVPLDVVVAAADQE